MLRFKFASLPVLRNALFSYQREQVHLPDSLLDGPMEGRDIGTVLFLKRT